MVRLPAFPSGRVMVPSAFSILSTPAVIPVLLEELKLGELNKLIIFA